MKGARKGYNKRMFLTADVFRLVGAVMEPLPPPLTGDRDSSLPEGL